ncbi:glucose-methanol-choline oxidoreductase [Methanobacterium lacus]|uniref:Glucose-methanol-choline oxidoreductase n=1 Tax=Methanobacterium lacus (strain AL-21) TaxID=877455 RepID=F0TAP1_METLA|nr:FAD-dependent oxidoreductase [Methanobacterium lacus]ADZ10113.1 glucose-methanol-choline oxidoreductase [Methanobacterium lacus]
MDMKDVIVVGTGAGGATVGRELIKRGMKVTFIERGPSDTTGNAYKHYDNCDVGVELLKTSCVGGTTLVTAGNAVRTCQEPFKKLGIDLETEFNEIEAEMGVSKLPDSHFGDGTNLIMKTAKELGFNTQKMPKFIEPQECKPCGKCAFGCPRNAKWTSQEYVNDSLNKGAKLVTDTNVTELIIKNNEIKGVKTQDKEFYADHVVLAAGGIETPRILRRSNIEAGNHLFVDSFITVGGLLKDIKFDTEVTMNSLISLGDVILAPHYSEMLVNNLREFDARSSDILGMMVKIGDEPSGKVREDHIQKFSTSKDVGLLAKGAAVAAAILKESGVDPKTLTSTIARGAHPGGTAAIGEVVDKNLETEVSGLFVSDASVFPWAPGAPPVLTIVALAKRLGNYIGSV